MKIAFVYYGKFSSFIKKDYDLLSRSYEVEKVNVSLPGYTTRLFKSILSSNLAFIWFAGGHAAAAVLLSKLLRKKSIIIVGGFDVACIPEVNYGRFTQSRTRRSLTKYALQYADRVLVVDPSLKDDAISNAGVSGYNIEYLPTGFQSHEFYPYGEKEDLVITVAMAESWDRARIKGIDIFVESARYLPDISFKVVGIGGEASSKLKESASENVEFTGYVSQEDLIRLYQRARVYCQLSMREGLPSSLCESMLCECIPVGTDRNGIPAAIGDTGFVVPYGEAKAAAEAIESALKDPGIRGKNARRRIIEMFSEDRREEGLLKIIDDLMKKRISD